ncbi:hypothetical protein BDZ89DRAFT_1058125 [Hymenopellis radicata]|nr:hypothetical protein BDZ89DRAFT_1058125 [Hymenopellis radicata]
MTPEHKHPDAGRQGPPGVKAEVEMHDQTTAAHGHSKAKRKIEQKSVVEKDTSDFDIDLALEEYHWETAWLAVDECERGTKALENMRLWAVDKASSQRYQDFAGRGRVYRVYDLEPSDQEMRHYEEAAREMESDEESDHWPCQWYDHYDGPDEFAPAKGEEPWTRGVCA